jgi:hypothetical protein
MQNKSRLPVGILVCLLIGLATFGSRNVLSSQGDGGRLEGTWNVVLTPRNCDTGVPFPSFAEIITFMSGGTMIDSTSALLALPATKTPGQGVWSHLTGNTYQYSFKFFNFGPDPNDNTKTVLLGSTIVSQTLELNSTANEYTSSGTAQFSNTSGVPGPLRCSTTTATRFE